MSYDVIIIGSGFSGIYTLKHCLEEGLRAIVLEKSSHIGGVWNIHNKPGGVQDFTYSVTSKLYLSATDYPPPEDWPEFPHASLVHEYLMDYVKHFQLSPNILTGMTVKDIKRTGDAWTLFVNEGHVWKAKHIVMATGVNQCPSYPKEPLFKKFTGPSLHSHYYTSKDVDKYAGKRVLIIGGSDTACDIAVHLCEKADKTYVSIRDGHWFQDRSLGAESPADMLYSRFVDWSVKNIVGKHYVHRYFSEEHIKLFWGEGGSDIDIWKPKCDYLNSYYNKSRDIIRMVAKGRITPTGRVKNIEGPFVECEGVEDPFAVDVIIYATGYNYKQCSPFLHEYIEAPRFKHIFPVLTVQNGGRNKYRFDNVALVGYIRPYLTSIPMLIELQSRYVAMVFSDKVQLPKPELMQKICIKDANKQKKEFACQSERIPFLVDPYDYSNSLARLMNVQPKYLQIWLQDPFLGFCLMVDSWNQFAFRVHDKDPVKKKLAVDMIKKYHHHKTCQKIRNIFYSYLIAFLVWSALLGIVGYYLLRFLRRSL